MHFKNKNLFTRSKKQNASHNQHIKTNFEQKFSIKHQKNMFIQNKNVFFSICVKSIFYLIFKMLIFLVVQIKYKKRKNKTLTPTTLQTPSGTQHVKSYNFTIQSKHNPNTLYKCFYTFRFFKQIKIPLNRSLAVSHWCCTFLCKSVSGSWRSTSVRNEETNCQALLESRVPVMRGLACRRFGNQQVPGRT